MDPSKAEGIENVDKCKTIIEACSNKSEAEVIVDYFNKALINKIDKRGDENLDLLNDRLKELFNKLNTTDEIEIAARKRVAYYSSTFRIERGLKMCGWMRSEYINLGYNPDLLKGTSVENKISRLSKGEEKVARGVRLSKKGHIF